MISVQELLKKKKPGYTELQGTDKPTSAKDICQIAQKSANNCVRTRYMGCRGEAHITHLTVKWTKTFLLFVEIRLTAPLIYAIINSTKTLLQKEKQE